MTKECNQQTLTTINQPPIHPSFMPGLHMKLNYFTGLLQLINIFQHDIVAETILE